MARTTKWAVLAMIGSLTLGLAGGPVSAQTDDDDDDMSGGALAVLLLAVGGAVPTPNSLGPQIKSSLDAKKVKNSDAQVRSLAKQAAAKLRSMRGPGQFTVCARSGPCLRVIRKAE